MAKDLTTLQGITSQKVTGTSLLSNVISVNTHLYASAGQIKSIESYLGSYGGLLLGWNGSLSQATQAMIVGVISSSFRGDEDESAYTDIFCFMSGDVDIKYVVYFLPL